MKGLILILLGIVFFNCTYSQEIRKGLIGISLGPSIPSGEYAKTYNSPGAGYAKKGLNMNINFNYKFGKNLGIAVLAAHNFNAMDGEALLSVYKAIDPSLVWSIDTDEWFTDYLLGGLLVSIQYDDRISFDLKALYGYSSSYHPLILIKAQDGSRTLSELQHQAKADDNALNFGAGIQIAISEKMAFSIDMDFYSTNPYFEVFSTSNFMPDEKNIIEQEMNMLNLTFGLGYQLK